MTIDGFAERTKTWPDIVKIDAEGYEGRVLKGGAKTFAAHRPFVLLELHQDKKIRFGAKRPEVVKLLFDLGLLCSSLIIRPRRAARWCK